MRTKSELKIPSSPSNPPTSSSSGSTEGWEWELWSVYTTVISVVVPCPCSTWAFPWNTVLSRLTPRGLPMGCSFPSIAPKWLCSMRPILQELLQHRSPQAAAPLHFPVHERILNSTCRSLRLSREGSCRLGAHMKCPQWPQEAAVASLPSLGMQSAPVTAVVGHCTEVGGSRDKGQQCDPHLESQRKQQHSSSSSRRHVGNQALCKDPFGEGCLQHLQGPPGHMSCVCLKASSSLDLCVCFSVSFKCSVLIFLTDPPPTPLSPHRASLPFWLSDGLETLLFRKNTTHYSPTPHPCCLNAPQ